MHLKKNHHRPGGPDSPSGEVFLSSSTNPGMPSKPGGPLAEDSPGGALVDSKPGGALIESSPGGALGASRPGGTLYAFVSARIFSESKPGGIDVIELAATALVGSSTLLWALTVRGVEEELGAEEGCLSLLCGAVSSE